MSERKYMIAEEYGVNAIEEIGKEVTTLMKNGWNPQGGIFIISGRGGFACFQAMIRQPDKESE